MTCSLRQGTTKAASATCVVLAQLLAVKLHTSRAECLCPCEGVRWSLSPPSSRTPTQLPDAWGKPIFFSKIFLKSANGLVGYYRRDRWVISLILQGRNLNKSRHTEIPPGVGRAGASPAKEGVGLAGEQWVAALSPCHKGGVREVPEEDGQGYNSLLVPSGQ